MDLRFSISGKFIVSDIPVVYSQVFRLTPQSELFAVELPNGLTILVQSYPPVGKYREVSIFDKRFTVPYRGFVNLKFVTRQYAPTLCSYSVEAVYAEGSDVLGCLTIRKDGEITFNMEVVETSESRRVYSKARLLLK